MEPTFSFFCGFVENVDFVKISQNHRKTNGFYWFFEVRPSKKRPQNDAETQLKHTSERNLSKIDFDLHFGLPKPPQIGPKSTRDAKKRCLERSLFRDAMQITRERSEINGGRPL